MFTKKRTRNVAIAISILVMVSISCGLFAPDANDIRSDAQQTATINAALTQAQIIVYGSPTPTVPGGPTATATDGPFISIVTDVPTNANTRLPFTPTATSTPTNTPPPTFTPVVAVTYTLTPQATSTVVHASDEETVREAVIEGCALGAPSVHIGAVTIECGGNVLPAPASYTAAPANVTPNGTDSDTCLTNAQLTAAHGWSNNYVKPLKNGLGVLWEGCGEWVTQAVGIGVYWQPFLADFEYTVTEANGKVSVNKGPHKGMWVWGATIRQLKTYTTPDQAWVHNDVTLMAREFNYGFRQDPRYGTVPGININLRGLWVQPKLDATCPTNTVMAAAILGGDEPSYWTAPKADEPWGAGVFNSKGKGFHHLTHPGGSGWFDVWTAANGAISVYADDAGLLETLNFEEASWHCN